MRFVPPASAECRTQGVEADFSKPFRSALNWPLVHLILPLARTSDCDMTLQGTPMDADKNG
jgi:hypothetical protein